MVQVLEETQSLVQWIKAKEEVLKNIEDKERKDSVSVNRSGN